LTLANLMTLCHIGFMGTTTVQVVGTTDANLVLREAVELAQEGYHLEYLVHGVLHRLWEGAPEDQAAQAERSAGARAGDDPHRECGREADQEV
jgi:hypothetical protein